MNRHQAMVVVFGLLVSTAFGQSPTKKTASPHRPKGNSGSSSGMTSSTARHSMSPNGRRPRMGSGVTPGGCEKPCHWMGTDIS